MKKENREMLKTIISNQELIMKALKIEIPLKEMTDAEPKKDEDRKAPEKKPVAKKSLVKKPVKNVRRK